MPFAICDPGTESGTTACFVIDNEKSGEYKVIVANVYVSDMQKHFFVAEFSDFEQWKQKVE